MQEQERRLAGEIDALLRAADATDVAEDVRLRPEVRGDELPAEFRRREDQARSGLPVLPPARAAEGAGRVGLGVPGGERQAPARADGGVTGTDPAPTDRESVTNRGVWAVYGLFFGTVPPVGRESPARRPAAYALTPCLMTQTAGVPRTPAAQTPSASSVR